MYTSHVPDYRFLLLGLDDNVFPRLRVRIRVLMHVCSYMSVSACKFFFCLYLYAFICVYMYTGQCISI